MKASSARVLVVDDFTPFRQWVCSRLREIADLQVVGEASDGLEAVRKAEELQPDLMLLDIGMPALNGFEVARWIQKLLPELKILFLSVESSADIVQEALSLGAVGYVVKGNAGAELPAAIEAVLDGRQFVSSELSSPPSLVVREQEITPRHEVGFYRDDASLLAAFSGFIEASLKAGKTAIFHATDSHRESLLQILRAQRWLDIDGALQQGTYIPLDTAETLSQFMISEVPDSDRLFAVVGHVIEGAAKAAGGKRPRLAICGECAPVLLAQGQAEAAIRLEQLTDRISRAYRVEMFCGYVLNSFHREEGENWFRRICAEHSAVR